MSALAGRWNFDGRPGADRDCQRILAAQSLYGSHDVAQWNAGAIALGRRLYRTLPEDIYDSQPLTDGHQVMIADVRLDNRDEMVGLLQLPPHDAGVMADSAILFAAWRRWGEGALDRLVGDYAFAVWHIAERRLSLIRDPLGMRPLHYHRERGFVAIASMPKGLHALPEIPRAPDEVKVAEFLALLPESGSRTFFKDVERVEAGHVLTIVADGMAGRRFWEPKRTVLKLANGGEYAEAMRHHLDQAVRSQLRGAGQAVGAHLSSGFDSSAVATSAALAMAQTGGRVIAFTSVPREGYDGPAPRGRHGDEGPIAAKTVARYPNMEHVLIRGGERSPLDDLDQYFYAYDRPVLNICNGTWSTAINQAARARKLSVVLTGQMGNMTISHGGETLLPQLVGSGRWIRWLREAAGIARNGYMTPLGVLSHSFGPYTPLPFWNWINRAVRNRDPGVESYSAIRPETLKALDIPRLARERALDLSYRPRKDGFESRLWVLRRIDLGNYHKGILGGWGVDQRDPTSDRRLVEFCLSLPEEQYLKDGVTKAVAREAFSSRLPPEVVQTRGRGYQAVDWHESLTAARPELRQEIARLEDCGPAATALDLPRLKNLVEDWPQDGWETEEVMRPYRLALLRGISAGHFLRRATGSNA
ncbi:MAG: asparagine synthase-related protein [Rhizomicrobium sp.]